MVGIYYNIMCVLRKMKDKFWLKPFRYFVKFKINECQTNPNLFMIFKKMEDAFKPQFNNIHLVYISRID